MQELSKSPKAKMLIHFVHHQKNTLFAQTKYIAIEELAEIRFPEYWSRGSLPHH